jgi:hypothetical protein
MNAKSATLSAAVLLGAASVQAFGAFGGGSPTLASPGPLPTTLAAMLGAPWFVISLIVSGSFCLWCKQLFMRQTTIPLRTWILFFGTTALTIAWYLAGWAYGLEWEGEFFTYGCAMISGLLFLACALFFYLAKQRKSFPASLAAHFVLFVWIFSYAFPWLGETP